MLRVEHVSVRYGEKTAVDDVSFRVEPGQWWTLAGPNGAGKTSLAAAVARSVKHDGKVILDEREAEDYKAGEYAIKVGMLSQINDIIYGFTVNEVVSMGRYAHRRGFLRGQDPDGEEKVDRALELTGLRDFRDRSMLTLSGGEIQRVFLAQVLAQDPELLILDEPANHLDLPFQRMFFDMVRAWLETPGKAVITVMHDLTLAKRYGTHALLMSEGKAAGCGPADGVLTPENLQAVYGMDVAGWMRESLEVWK
jgi:ABC-type cobalamin/Fe3+-siderophores transport systems, ATPase components